MIRISTPTLRKFKKIELAQSKPYPRLSFKRKYCVVPTMAVAPMPEPSASLSTIWRGTLSTSQHWISCEVNHSVNAYIGDLERCKRWPCSKAIRKNCTLSFSRRPFQTDVSVGVVKMFTPSEFVTCARKSLCLHMEHDISQLFQ